MATTAQKAKATERRARMRELSQRLAAMSEAERQAMAESAGAVQTIEGRPLSPHNTCMVVSQLGGGVSVVGGFRQWRQAGRTVRQGEHGAAIWCRTGGAGETEGAEAAEAAAKPGFIMGTVFDIGQTEPLAAQSQAAG